MEVYFLYSKQQLNMLKETTKKTGRKYTPGTVLVRGELKYFTEISDTINSMYSDISVVAKGELDKFRYTEPKIE